MIASGTSLRLAAVAPFDFGRSLAFLGGFPPGHGEQVLTDEAVTWAFRAAGRTVVARVAGEGPAGVRVDVLAPECPDDELLAAIRDRVRFRFSLDDDLGGFCAAGERDPAFAPVLRRLSGLHQVKFGTPIELAVWAVLGQRTPMTVARSAKQALAAEFDDTNRVVVAGVEYRAFPDGAQLAGLADRRWAELVRNTRKAGYLPRLVRGFAEADERWLRTAPVARVRRFLEALPGLGPWSASFVLIRGLGRTEELSGDQALMDAASRVYGRPVDLAGLRELAGRYGSDQGYWGFYLRVGG